MLTKYWSVGVSIGISIAFVAVFAASRLRNRGDLFKHVRGYDLMSFAFLNSRLVRGSPALSIVWWMIVSMIVGILLPMFGHHEFFEGVRGLVITLNYSFLVPVLLGSYHSALAAANDLLRPSELAAAGLEFREKQEPDRVSGLIRRHWPRILVAFGLVVQTLAIRSEFKNPGPNDPWVRLDKDGIPEGLTFVGMAYYSLRGVDAMMALGLFSSLFWTLWTCMTRLRVADGKLYLPTMEVRPSIRNIGTSLFSCAVVVNAVLVLHGIGLYLETPAFQGNAHVRCADLGPVGLVSHLFFGLCPDTIESIETHRASSGLVGLLLNSTWVLWFVLTVVLSTFVCGCLLWFHRLLLLERIHRERTAVAALGQEPVMPAAAEALSATDPVGANRQALEVQGKYWESRERIRKMFHDASASAVPRWGLLTIMLGPVCQIASVVIGAMLKPK